MQYFQTCKLAIILREMYWFQILGPRRNPQYSTAIHFNNHKMLKVKVNLVDLKTNNKHELNTAKNLLQRANDIPARHFTCQ